MSGSEGLNMRPMLMCKEAHLSDIPIVKNAYDIGGDILCTQCGKPMVLITYGILGKADWSTITWDAERRARGTWWR